MLRRYKHSGEQDASKKRVAVSISAISAVTILVVIIVAFSMTPQQQEKPPLAPELKEQPKGIVSSDKKSINFASFSPDINLFTYPTRFGGVGTFYTKTSQVSGKVVAVTESGVSGWVTVTCPVAGEVGESISISGIWSTSAVDSTMMIRSKESQKMGWFGQFKNNFFYTTPSMVTLATPSNGDAYTITFTLIDSTNTELKITYGTTTKSVIIPYYMPDLTPGFVPSIKYVAMSRFATPGISFTLTSISTSWESNIGDIVYL